MKQLCLPTLIFLISCGNSSANKNEATTSLDNSKSSVMEVQQRVIVGEWEQQYTAFDKNGNYKLEPEEKKASGTHLGFNWFKFNADGSCLRDKEIRFKGNYELIEKNNTKKLYIRGGDNLRYTIVECTDRELILGSDGAFIIFKRVK